MDDIDKHPAENETEWKSPAILVWRESARNTEIRKRKEGRKEHAFVEYLLL